MNPVSLRDGQSIVAWGQTNPGADFVSFGLILWVWGRDDSEDFYAVRKRSGHRHLVKACPCIHDDDAIHDFPRPVHARRAFDHIRRPRVPICQQNRRFDPDRDIFVYKGGRRKTVVVSRPGGTVDASVTYDYNRVHQLTGGTVIINGQNSIRAHGYNDQGLRVSMTVNGLVTQKRFLMSTTGS
jgi:hypothetical protein